MADLLHVGFSVSPAGINRILTYSLKQSHLSCNQRQRGNVGISLFSTSDVASGHGIRVKIEEGTPD